MTTRKEPSGRVRKTRRLAKPKKTRKQTAADLSRKVLGLLPGETLNPFFEHPIRLDGSNAPTSSPKGSSSKRGGTLDAKLREDLRRFEARHRKAQDHW